MDDEDSDLNPGHGDDKSATTDQDNPNHTEAVHSSTTGIVKDADNDDWSSMDHALSTTKKAKRKRKSYDTIKDEDLLPSQARRTKKGGYAHTNLSKSKISQANMGNTPWNKGKNRSSSDRAKIAAGVRARNRAVLLEKLKRLGMSEEEWLAKKREIKYLRERLRRSKLSKKKHDESEAATKLRAVETERKLQAAIEATTFKMEDDPAETENIEEKAREAGPIPPAFEEIFYKEVEWTPFSFGKDDNDTNDENDHDNMDYDQACPSGGPGGLVCCQHCAETYTWYLSRTVKDMEIHRTSRVGKEVQELLKFLNEGRQTLENAYNVAKKKVPPLPPKPPTTPHATTATTTSRPNSRKNQTSIPLEPTQWNMTSTIDIARQSTGNSVMQV